MGRPWILDGGLATGLEERGITLHPRLWSAGAFLEDPGAVLALHRAYLDAGAEILISASYQMSFVGLEREGLGREAAVRAMLATVRVARRAVEQRGRAAMVAASIGPYGATLADGSEYRGDYGLDVEALVRFHRERFEVLSGAGADLVAIETVPALDEARAWGRLLARGRAPRAWLSFCCRDGAHLADGSPIREAVRSIEACPRLFAIGVNCTAPEHVAALVGEIRRETQKPVVVYPNSGERWDASRRQWSGAVDEERFVSLARVWSALGVWAVGGCCRVGPALVGRVARALGRA